MEITLLISALILISYVAGIIFKFGVPDSLSESYYILEKAYPNKSTKWLFTLLCYTVMFTVLIPWLNISNPNLQFLSFLSASGLGFVGTAPLFKSHQHTIHVAGAALCGLFSQAWLVASGYWYLPLIALGTMAIPYSIQKKNKVFYAEMAAFLSTYLGIGIEYLK